ncbi:MAG TPA: FHA domain-containing protein [Myxococcota bacterium]|nr:FHA domain-containing protein [Myxococcota bacterium]
MVAATAAAAGLAVLAGVPAAAWAKPRVAKVVVNAEKGEMTLWVDIRKGDAVVKTPEKGKLQILIDGKPLSAVPDLTTFGDHGDGYSIVFVVDAGDVWDRNWNDIKEAVKGYVSRMRGDKNKVALVLLREGRVDTAVNFTSEITEIGAYLDKVTETAGIEPRIFNAIDLAIKMHGEDTSNWRKVIVFGTDLEDESFMDPTRYSAAGTDLLKELDKSDVEISTIFMTTKIGADGAPEEDEKVVNKVKKLADKSNGFFRKLRGVEGVAAKFKEIADDVNAMTVITIKPDFWPKEGTHLLTVRYDELDSKDTEVTFPPPPRPPDDCELDADCGTGKVCVKGPHPWTCAAEVKKAECKSDDDCGDDKACVKEKCVKAPPTSIFSQWWFWVLCGLGGLGLIVLVVALIAGRSSAPEAPQEAPVASGSNCMECGQLSKPGPRCMEGCANRARGKLVCTSGNMSGKIFYILDEITTFGKAPGNNYVVFDDAVSSKHFGIKIEEARYELADFGSTNGTFINGTKATKQYLKTGDTIRVGNTEMTFSLK